MNTTISPSNGQNAAALVGRLLLAALFLPAGIGKLTGFEATVAYIASVGLPLPQVAAALAGALEIAGGIALIAGVGTRVAALALAAFTAVATVFFHAYWSAPAGQQMVQQLLFFKNVAVVGGLATLAAWGAGAWRFGPRRALA